nr:hypothetical protein [Tanacetum cinerariifolium]
SHELKTISYHKLYDILKQHQNEVNEIRAKRIARVANPLTLVAQQQPVARETVGSTVVQKSRIQCYNCKEFGHVARKCQKPKRVKDVAYHREKMLLYQELKAHYMYMAKLQEVSPDAADSGPIFDTEPVQKAQAELARRNDVEYASKKEAQIKLYKTRKDKELDKDIALEIKVKVLDNIVYKTGQSVQTMNMLNNKCRMSFAKHEFLKKAQRGNPRLYDIGCYNDNLALMLAHESDEVIRIEKESRSKLRDLIRPFDYDKLNNLYDLFVPQRKKLAEQRYFSKRSRLSHTPVNNGNSKEFFKKQTTLLEKRMDESIP